MLTATVWQRFLYLSNCTKPASKKNPSNLTNAFDDLMRLFFRCIKIKVCGVMETLSHFAHVTSSLQVKIAHYVWKEKEITKHQFKVIKDKNITKTFNRHTCKFSFVKVLFLLKTVMEIKLLLVSL